MTRQITIGFAFVVGLAASSDAQAVRYVDANAGGGANDGSSWCDAYLDLYDAVAVAGSGDTIRVADGTYLPDTSGLGDPREATFQLITGVTLGGGLGATAGVLAAGKILGVEGRAPGCLLGALAGGLVSAFVEPLLYLLGIPEETTELLGFLFLPIAPAIGATIGFNWSGADPG